MLHPYPKHYFTKSKTAHFKPRRPNKCNFIYKKINTYILSIFYFTHPQNRAKIKNWPVQAFLANQGTRIYPKSVLGQVEFYIFGKIKLIITKLPVSIANIKFTNCWQGASFLKSQKIRMNNFFWSILHPKANQPKGTASARVYFAEFRQDSGTGHGYFYAGNRISLQEQNGIRGFMGRPIKRNGKKRCRIRFKPGRGDKWPWPAAFGARN